MFLTIVTFFAILGVIVVVHEAGHFITARRGGIKVDEFGLGLPPRAFGFYKNDEGKWVRVGRKTPTIDKTIWSLNWIPLGGFVKIKGEEGDGTDDPDSFANKSIGRRIVVLTAGVTMNILLAIILLTIGFMIGMPQVVDESKLSSMARVEKNEIKVVDILEGSPAHQAGVKVADSIFEVDGEAFVKVENLQDYMDEHIGLDVNLSVQRGDEVLDFIVVPEILPETERAGMGVALVKIGFVSYPWYIAWWYGAAETFSMVVSMLVGFFVIIKSLVVGQGLVGEVYGPVGIATLVGDAVDLGFLYVLQFTAVLSIIIAVVNYLPFPALDGGRVVFLILEALRGKPVDPKIEAMIHNLGFALLMILVVIVTYRDIARLSGGIFTRLTGLI